MSRAASKAVMNARVSVTAGRPKQDSHPAAVAAKVEIRRNVLGLVKPAKVFDAFCGKGGMYTAAWKDADLYVGCDVRPWAVTDPPRYVADNLRLMRAIELGAFNVFDLDAYGSPWEQAEILLHRRKWAKGERGALVLTDGHTMKMKLGFVGSAVQRITGLRSVPTLSSAAHDLQRICLEKWMERAEVRPVKVWMARGNFNASGKTGGSDALYVAAVFDGT